MYVDKSVEELVIDYEQCNQIDEQIKQTVKDEIAKEDFRAAYIISISQKNGDGPAKEYCRFDGLLHLARLSRWNGCTITVIQTPDKNNGNLAIVHATVYDWRWRSYDAIGDCDDANAGHIEMAKHKVRIAETRAVGRALRKMLKVDMVMFEELDMERTVTELAEKAKSGNIGGNQFHTSPPSKATKSYEAPVAQPAQVTPPRASAPQANSTTNGHVEYITKGQVDTIKGLIKLKGVSREDCQKALERVTRPKGKEDVVGLGKTKASQCTKDEAERFIEWLRSLPDAPQAHTSTG